MVTHYGVTAAFLFKMAAYGIALAIMNNDTETF
jgi:hypothetical protein